MAIQNRENLILVDSHVHLYNCFDFDCFFDSALANFSVCAKNYHGSEDFTPFLLLTETRDDHYFQALSRSLEKDSERLDDRRNSPLKTWTLHPTSESCSLRARSRDGRDLYVVAGRQIVTAEDLEVLALLTDGDFEDGLPLETTVERTLAAGGVPVIPWGFGKWLGRRGTILEALLQDNPFPVLFLGDNSGRPIFWPRPPLFDRADRQGVRVLRGTDPLPFERESFRPGAFGFATRGPLDPERPARSLKQLLLDAETELFEYGSLENPWRFIRNQISMQIVKRQRRKA
ncbi:MAG: hypothetical protein SWY16_27170 [Cyanobacteriota bacterium]|nr:hypothetical protein [Cyanobacteriota bacterium]